ncbi:Molybdopterin oxidoreductase [Ruminococcaceae bacterium BL-6]|nr:Molybdopterin oxidoreductase [Ruminococcaceae bacterium BL-6]
MLKTMTCIICPRGCAIQVETKDGKPVSVKGAGCRRGEKYAWQETVSPMRTIASSVLVLNGELPLASVRLTKPVPISRIFPVMEQIKKVRLRAPVAIGQVVIPDVLGLGSDVVATRNVGAAVSKSHLA